MRVGVTGIPISAVPCVLLLIFFFSRELITGAGGGLFFSSITKIPNSPKMKTSYVRTYVRTYSECTLQAPVDYSRKRRTAVTILLLQQHAAAFQGNQRRRRLSSCGRRTRCPSAFAGDEACPSERRTKKNTDNSVVLLRQPDNKYISYIYIYRAGARLKTSPKQRL